MTAEVVILWEPTFEVLAWQGSTCRKGSGIYHLTEEECGDNAVSHRALKLEGKYYMLDHQVLVRPYGDGK